MQILSDYFRFFVSIALGCVIGCARLVMYRQAYMYVFLEFSGNLLSGKDPRSSAEYWQQFCTYWVPLVLLVSVEKMFITYADFQVNMPQQDCCFSLLILQLLNPVFRYCITRCTSCYRRKVFRISDGGFHFF
jgi:hypothetical protein